MIGKTPFRDVTSNTDQKNPCLRAVLPNGSEVHADFEINEDGVVVVAVTHSTDVTLNVECGGRLLT